MSTKLISFGFAKPQFFNVNKNFQSQYSYKCANPNYPIIP